MIKNNIDFSCHKTEYISHKSKKPETNLNNTNEITLKKVSLLKMFFKNQVQTRTVMLKNLNNFRFNEKLRYAEDLDLWIRMLLSKYNIFYFNGELALSCQPLYNNEGLSSHLLAFQKSELIVLFHNGTKSFLTFVLLIFILLFSLIKFVRRIILIKTKVLLNV